MTVKKPKTDNYMPHEFIMILALGNPCLIWFTDNTSEFTCTRLYVHQSRFNQNASENIHYPACWIHFFKAITHVRVLYLYLIRYPINMHWAVKWHKVLDYFMVLVLGLVCLLMDRWCIQIMIVNTHSPFNHI